MLKSTGSIIVVIVLIIIATITTVTTLLTVHPSRKPTRSESQSASPSTASSVVPSNEPSASTMMPTFKFSVEAVFSITLAGTCISTDEIVEELLYIIENAVPSSLHDSGASFVIAKTESSCDSWERRQLMNTVAIGTIRHIIVAQIKLGGDDLIEAIKDDLLGKDLSSGVFVDSIGLIIPSDAPSLQPSLSINPSTAPSDLPSVSLSPSAAPSELPSVSLSPSPAPSDVPSISVSPTISPSISPASESQSPSTSLTPSQSPTTKPSIFPSLHINTWTKLGGDVFGKSAYGKFGTGICLSKDGTVLSVGGPAQNGNGNDRSGHVRVYKLSGGQWIQRGDDFYGDAAHDYLGKSVALSADGSVVSMGAQFSQSENGFNSGHVRVYEWSKDGSSEEAWAQQKGRTINGEGAGDLSGYSVTMNEYGNIIGIGAYANDRYSGHVRVFEFKNGSWDQKGQDINGRDQSGWSISLDSSGSTIAIGAPGSDRNAYSSGHVRVYDWRDGSTSWVKRGEDINGGSPGDRSGSSVSVNDAGTVVAIGLRNALISTGMATVYEWRDKEGWIQRGHLKPCFMVDHYLMVKSPFGVS